MLESFIMSNFCKTIKRDFHPEIGNTLLKYGEGKYCWIGYFSVSSIGIYYDLFLNNGPLDEKEYRLNKAILWRLERKILTGHLIVWGHNGEVL